MVAVGTIIVDRPRTEPYERHYAYGSQLGGLASGATTRTPFNPWDTQSPHCVGRVLNHREAIAAMDFDVPLGEQEPAWCSVANELMCLPNVVLTPHVAGASREGLARGNLLAAQGIVAGFDGGSPAVECIVVDGRAATK
jgi:hypothetical protein